MTYSHETIERFNTARTRMMRLRSVRALPLTALRSFEAAARHGSFTRAAEELHVTQGAISRQVQALEERIGVALFERAGRNISLSFEGRLLAQAATEALERLGEAVVTLTRSRRVLTISTVPSIAAFWLAPKLGAFADAHPDVELHVSASRHLVDFEREGIDAAIRYGPGGWDDVDSELLARDDIFPVCSPAYVERLKLQTPRDLERARFLHNDVPDGWREWLEAAGCTDIYTEKGLYVDEDTALMRAAADGEGVALGRSVLVAGDIASGRLVAPFAISMPATFSYWFVTPLRGRRNHHLDTFRSWLMDSLGRSIQ